MNNLNKQAGNAVNSQNAFGFPIYEIKDVLRDHEIKEVIKAMLKNVFIKLGIPSDKSDVIVAECLNYASSCTDENEYEKLANAVLVREGIDKAIPDKLLDRARIMYEQIKPYLNTGSILDLGCGDARLSQLLEQGGYTLQLTDVYENSNVANIKLSFKLLGQDDVLPFKDNQFDNTLLLTVLHHSDDPIKVMREAQRVTRAGGKIIVIESVYDVNGQELSLVERAQVQSYLSLNSEQQRKVNIIFDHLYNRVIHYSEDLSKKVNVPFNFNSPGAWKQLFEKNGLKQEKIIHLGVDQPVVPEYHTLHVLTVIK